MEAAAMQRYRAIASRFPVTAFSGDRLEMGRCR
jgi:hypothetical protein